MPFEPLITITAIKILKEIGTIGSSPLLVIDKDGNQYYAKTTTFNLPKAELINEVFCAYALQCWDLKVPPVCLIQIPYQLVEQYNRENAVPISNRYKLQYFGETLFFGSQNLGNAVELQDFLPGITKSQFKNLYLPQDLIKIGVFDLWVGNKDRRPENPNFLMVFEDGKIRFCAIDHTAAFAHISDYQQVRDIMLGMKRNDGILATKLAKSIGELLPSKITKNLRDDILTGMENVRIEFDTIVELIPKQWGFSKKAKAHLKAFFNNMERNKRIANSFIDY